MSTLLFYVRSLVLTLAVIAAFCLVSGVTAMAYYLTISAWVFHLAHENLLGTVRWYGLSAGITLTAIPIVGLFWHYGVIVTVLVVALLMACALCGMAAIFTAHLGWRQVWVVFAASCGIVSPLFLLGSLQFNPLLSVLLVASVLVAGFGLPWLVRRAQLHQASRAK